MANTTERILKLTIQGKEQFVDLNSILGRTYNSLTDAKQAQELLTTALRQVKQGTDDYKDLEAELKAANTSFDALIDTATRGIGTINQLEEAQRELNEQFKAAAIGTEEYKQLEVQLRTVSSTLEQAQESVRGLNTDDKVDAFFNLTQGIVGGFGLAEVAITSFSDNAANADLVIQKLQKSFLTVTTVLQGLDSLRQTFTTRNLNFIKGILNSIASLGAQSVATKVNTAAEQENTVATEQNAGAKGTAAAAAGGLAVAEGGATIATRVLGVAMRALPIVFIVAAIVGLIGYFKDLISTTNEAANAQARFNLIQKNAEVVSKFAQTNAALADARRQAIQDEIDLVLRKQKVDEAAATSVTQKQKIQADALKEIIKLQERLAAVNIENKNGIVGLAGTSQADAKSLNDAAAVLRDKIAANDALVTTIELEEKYLNSLQKQRDLQAELEKANSRDIKQMVGLGPNPKVIGLKEEITKAKAETAAISNQLIESSGKIMQSVSDFRSKLGFDIIADTPEKLRESIDKLAPVIQANSARFAAELADNRAQLEALNNLEDSRLEAQQQKREAARISAEDQLAKLQSIADEALRKVEKARSENKELDVISNLQFKAIQAQEDVEKRRLDIGQSLVLAAGDVTQAKLIETEADKKLLELEAQRSNIIAEIKVNGTEAAKAIAQLALDEDLKRANAELDKLSAGLETLGKAAANPVNATSVRDRVQQVAALQNDAVDRGQTVDTIPGLGKSAQEIGNDFDQLKQFVRSYYLVVRQQSLDATEKVYNQTIKTADAEEKATKSQIALLKEKERQQLKDAEIQALSEGNYVKAAELNKSQKDLEIIRQEETAEAAKKAEQAKAKAALDRKNKINQINADQAEVEKGLQETSLQNFLKINQQLVQQVIDLTSQAVSTLFDALNTSLNNQLGALEEKLTATEVRLNALQSSYQDALALEKELEDQLSTARDGNYQQLVTRLDGERSKRAALAAQIANEEAKKAEYEKKRIELERKAFNLRKAQSIAEATIRGAVAAINALTVAPPAGFVLAGIIGAITAANIAVIASQKYKRGGVLEGPLHEYGGVQLGGGAEAEGGEFITNRKATALFRPQLEAINNAVDPITGQVRIPNQANLNMAVNDPDAEVKALLTAIRDKSYTVSVVDINKGQKRVNVIENDATI